MFVFFQCVAESIAENGVRGLMSMVPGGAFAVAVAGGALAKYKQRKRHAELLVEIEKMSVTNAAEANKAADETVEAVIPEANADEKAAMAGYLANIPAAVNQSLRRPSDPSGKTVPSAFALTTPDDVLRLLPPRPPRFKVGDELPGSPQWHLKRVLGVGGFGEVWLAQHTSLGLESAVKFCHGTHASDLKHESHVITQVQLAGEHPCVVPLRDASLTGETPWLRFDFVSGGDLGDWIRLVHRHPAADRPRQILQALRQITQAVATFHRLTPAVVHRDLKPSNILLDRVGKRLRVTDFGIGAVTAKATLSEEANGGVTRSGRMLSSHRGSHTPIYAGPQQRSGADPDPRDDIHAIGVIAYQMFTGHLTQGPGTDYTHDLADAGTPQPLIDLIGRCVAQNPVRRPANATALAAELNNLIAALQLPSTVKVPSPDSTITSPPPTTATETVRVPAEATITAQAKEPASGGSPESPGETQRPGSSGLPQFETDRELDIHVSGSWRMNRMVKPFARWRMVSKLPAKVHIRSGEVYQLGIMRSARDANVQGLVNLVGVGPLIELDLSGCKKLSREGYSLAAKLTQIRSLLLAQSSINDATLKLFAKLPQLESLDLEKTAITDAGLAHLRSLRTLQKLKLMGASISDAGLASLTSLRRIRTLDLHGTAITEAGVPLLAKFPRLESLGLAGIQITDEGINHLLGLSKLQSVLLSSSALTEVGLAQLATMKKMVCLWLPSCPGVTDRSLSLFARMKHLQRLDVMNTAVTDAGIASLRAAPVLNDLCLEDCPNITDVAIDHLIAMKELKQVNLRGTAVTTDGVVRLRNARPECTVLHPSGGAPVVKPQHSSEDASVEEV